MVLIEGLSLYLGHLFALSEWRCPKQDKHLYNGVVTNIWLQGEEGISIGTRVCRVGDTATAFTVDLGVDKADASFRFWTKIVDPLTCRSVAFRSVEDCAMIAPEAELVSGPQDIKYRAREAGCKMGDWMPVVDNSVIRVSKHGHVEFQMTVSSTDYWTMVSALPCLTGTSREPNGNLTYFAGGRERPRLLCCYHRLQDARVGHRQPSGGLLLHGDLRRR